MCIRTRNGTIRCRVCLIPLCGAAPSAAPFFGWGLPLSMAVEGEIVEVRLLADTRIQFDALVDKVSGNQIVLMCFQKLPQQSAIGLECARGFAVGFAVGVVGESDGLISYAVKIKEIVTQREARIHMSWRSPRE